MIQTASSPVRESADALRTRRITIWGLTASELHDAFWRARGVQCVRRGWRESIDRDADLYLLLQPNQLVLFDIASLSQRLQWNDAAVTRLRLVDAEEDTYHEQVLLDDDGAVTRIQRQYDSRQQGVSFAVLTESKRIATLWMNSAGRREAWDRVRRSVPWTRVAHWRGEGKAFRTDRSSDEELLLNDLVKRWPNPGQVINGLAERTDGVWSSDAARLATSTVCIGPLWMGIGAVPGDRACIVGPTWLPDATGGPPPTPSVVRSIAEVELAETVSDAQPSSKGRVYPTLKRGFDILVSAILLVVFAPLMGLISLLVMAQDGRPIYFGHRRQGRGGVSFKCWKFRTMQIDAERMARDFDEYNICDGPQVFIQNDPRVTKLGRILRTTHLDELPQLWNVFVGQMSLVGPRPSPDNENQFCPAWRDLRLSVRPGITGLWQVRRTREPGADFQEWIKYDIEYVRRAGLWLDFRILVWTGVAFFAGRIDSAVE